MKAIETRLQKLEKTVVDDRLCNCSPGAGKIVFCDTTETSEAEIPAQIAEAQKPKHCETCGKVMKETLVIFH